MLKRDDNILQKVLATSLNVLSHNYFNGPKKLFSDLYPAKFLDFTF